VVAGGIIVELSKHFANAVVGSPEKLEAEKFEEMHRRLDGRSFQISRSSPTAEPTPARRTGVARTGRTTDKTTSPVMEHVREAMNHLALAEKATNCGVCKKGAAAAREAVKRESEVIVRADSKYNVIQDLKAAGAIPEDSRWDKLKPEQKSWINKKVERSIQNGTY
jgi:hypothetical protein